MRAAGSLAGVEFIAPPRNLDQDTWGNQRITTRELWAEIITESGYFFSRDAMKFFSSRVIWDSLTGIDQETYGFITSEQNQFLYFQPEPRRYTVRKWTKENGIASLSEFQQFATLREARYFLRNAGWKRGN